MSDLALLRFSSQIKALKANKKHARMSPGMLFYRVIISGRLAPDDELSLV